MPDCLGRGWMRMVAAEEVVVVVLVERKLPLPQR